MRYEASQIVILRGQCARLGCCISGVVLYNVSSSGGPHEGMCHSKWAGMRIHFKHPAHYWTKERTPHDIDTAVVLCVTYFI